MKKFKIFCITFLFFPTIVYAQSKYDVQRNRMIEETLCAIEMKVSKEKINLAQEARGQIQGFTFGEAYLALGLRFGSLKGNTAYDFDHHTSELEYPMDNGMVGGNLS